MNRKDQRSTRVYSQLDSLGQRILDLAMKHRLQKIVAKPKASSEVPDQALDNARGNPSTEHNPKVPVFLTETVLPPTEMKITERNPTLLKTVEKINLNNTTDLPSITSAPVLIQRVISQFDYITIGHQKVLELKSKNHYIT